MLSITFVRGNKTSNTRQGLNKTGGIYHDCKERTIQIMGNTVSLFKEGQGERGWGGRQRQDELQRQIEGRGVRRDWKEREGGGGREKESERQG